MIYLGIESSAVAASAAIVETNEAENKIIAAGTVNAAVTHSETLMPLMESLLKSAKIKLTDIDCFAVTNGPGSFTGLRISVSAVKGMAYALGKPVCGVSSMLALAYNLKGFSGIACPVMDARCGQVYNALFKTDGENIIRMTEDRALSLSELEKELIEKYSGKKIILVGDGAEIAMDAMNSKSISVIYAPLLLRLQNAVSVCLAASDAECTVTAEELMPSYLRLPQAERERLKKISG